MNRLQETSLKLVQQQTRRKAAQDKRVSLQSRFRKMLAFVDRRATKRSH